MNKKKISIVGGPERPRGGDYYYITVEVTYEDERTFAGIAMFDELNTNSVSNAVSIAVAKADALAGIQNNTAISTAIEIASELSGKLHMKTLDEESQKEALLALCGDEEENEIAKACYQVGILPITVKDKSNKAVFYCMRSILKQMAISYPVEPTEE